MFEIKYKKWCVETTILFGEHCSILLLRLSGKGLPPTVSFPLHALVGPILRAHGPNTFRDSLLALILKSNHLPLQLFAFNNLNLHCETRRLLVKMLLFILYTLGYDYEVKIPKQLIYCIIWLQHYHSS